ncbi:MAG: hypothetical protein HY744_08745 [Deltaproteobacteria bacterium]|nr:hypothetical protein [Deltaproteobacteria bacterium]
MLIREQVEVLAIEAVEAVVVGGQAGVLRQAIEFSHDLDILIRPTPENAVRVRRAVRAITGVDAAEQTILGRDFQQYVDAETGTEIDVHLKVLALPDFATALAHSSEVAFLGQPVRCLELPALYASKRTDRLRDAVHRQAIEARLRQLVLGGAIEPDEVVLACCLDAAVAALTEIAPQLLPLAASTSQPLLQVRLLAAGAAPEALSHNPHLHRSVRALLALERPTRHKILDHPSRLAALLARVPLVLPPEGHHPRPRG